MAAYFATPRDVIRSSTASLTLTYVPIDLRNEGAFRNIVNRASKELFHRPCCDRANANGKSSFKSYMDLPTGSPRMPASCLVELKTTSGFDRWQARPLPIHECASLCPFIFWCCGVQTKKMAVAGGDASIRIIDIVEERTIDVY